MTPPISKVLFLINKALLRYCVFSSKVENTVLFKIISTLSTLLLLEVLNIGNTGNDNGMLYIYVERKGKAKQKKIIGKAVHSAIELIINKTLFK
jgi:hypothetical protein